MWNVAFVFVRLVKESPTVESAWAVSFSPKKMTTRSPVVCVNVRVCDVDDAPVPSVTPRTVGVVGMATSERDAHDAAGVPDDGKPAARDALGAREAVVREA